MPSVITRNHNHPAEDPADIKASRGTRKRAREILNHEQKICVAKKQLRKGVPKPISGRDDLSLVQLRNIRYYDQHKDLPSKDPMKNIEDMHTKTGFLFELTTTPLRIIFIPKEAIPFIQKATLLLIDTTFEMADDKEIKITTIMVNTKEDDMFFPAAWMLHKETSKPLYVSFLHALKTAVEGRLSLVAALSDFDQSISGAIKEELRCEWFGDYFHFKQANLKWLHANKLKEYSTQLNHDLGILYHSATRAEWKYLHITQRIFEINGRIGSIQIHGHFMADPYLFLLETIFKKLGTDEQRMNCTKSCGLISWQHGLQGSGIIGLEPLQVRQRESRRLRRLKGIEKPAKRNNL
mmetsp:Transcript_11644/g.16162  ORF Transcript_11644/g.16162 Transcript_11644/m.16162 type:complete len:351 (-) Transcript_11644:636-1688(-)